MKFFNKISLISNDKVVDVKDSIRTYGGWSKKVIPVISIFLIILAIGATGCTSRTSTPSTRVSSEPFVGTWENTESQVRIQAFENYSIIASADNPCNISALDSSILLCTSYVFIDGNWTYGPNQTYHVEIRGKTTARNPFGGPKTTRYVKYFNEPGTDVYYRVIRWNATTGSQTNYYSFIYNVTTDSIQNQYYGESWVRIS